MAAPKNNTFAQKPKRERASDHLQIRVRPVDKRRWAEAASIRASRDPSMTGKVSGWAIDVLNAEADYELKKKKA